MTCFKEASLVSRSSLNKTALNVMLLDVKNPDFANKDDTGIVSPQVSYFSYWSLQFPFSTTNFLHDASLSAKSFPFLGSGMAQLRVSYSEAEWGWGFLHILWVSQTILQNSVYNIHLGKGSETWVLRNRSRTTLAIATGFSHLFCVIVCSIVPTRRWEIKV